MEWYGSIHNHSEYSNFRLRDSINRIADMVDYAMELGHNFIAITEHETIASALEAQKIEKQAREKDPSFKIIRGNEIYLCRNGLNQDNFILSGLQEPAKAPKIPATKLPHRGRSG